MKKKKSKNSIEEIRKNSKWLKLFENIPYNNSKVGQTFIMKVSSRKNPKSQAYPPLSFLLFLDDEAKKSLKLMRLNSCDK